MESDLPVHSPHERELDSSDRGAVRAEHGPHLTQGECNEPVRREFSEVNEITVDSSDRALGSSNDAEMEPHLPVYPCNERKLHAGDCRTVRAEYGADAAQGNAESSDAEQHPRNIGGRIRSAHRADDAEMESHLPVNNSPGERQLGTSHRRTGSLADGAHSPVVERNGRDRDYARDNPECAAHQWGVGFGWIGAQAPVQYPGLLGKCLLVQVVSVSGLCPHRATRP